MIVYHGTTRRRALRIRDEGFQPKKPSRKVWFRDAGFVDADIYERASLGSGATFTGPAIVEQPDTTTVMPPDTTCTVDDYGNLIISVGR